MRKEKERFWRVKCTGQAFLLVNLNGSLIFARWALHLRLQRWAENTKFSKPWPQRPSVRLFLLESPEPIRISACGWTCLPWQHQGSRPPGTIPSGSWDLLSDWKLHNPKTGRAADGTASLALTPGIEDNFPGSSCVKALTPTSPSQPWDRAQKQGEGIAQR